MNGFETILAHNGWYMALAGGIIVFTGLILLAAAISQIHKLVTILDKKIPKKNNTATKK